MGNTYGTDPARVTSVNGGTGDVTVRYLYDQEGKGAFTDLYFMQDVPWHNHNNVVYFHIGGGKNTKDKMVPVYLTALLDDEQVKVQFGGIQQTFYTSKFPPPYPVTAEDMERLTARVVALEAKLGITADAPMDGPEIAETLRGGVILPLERASERRWAA